MKSFVKTIWCLLFHRDDFKYDGIGDWKIINCERCRNSWVEPR